MKENPHFPSKRLWIITELYYPEETSTGYYMTRIAEGLAEDFEVSVLCGQPAYSARGTIAPKQEIHKGVNIYRAAGTTLDKNIIVFRLINMVTLGLSILLKAIRNFRRGDRVLVVTTPPSLPFIAAFASLIRGSSYTLLIHDNYPEILLAVGKLSERSLLVQCINYCNRWLYKYARKIIVVGRDMRELVTKKVEGLEIPIAEIPNWAELETVEPAPRSLNPLLEELGLTDKFVLLYAGNMGHPNDLETIVECAESLVEFPQIHFVFLGSGVKKPWLEGERSRRNLTNITLLDPLPRSEQGVFLNACDVGIVSLISRMWGVSMPSRTYNILAAGKPILALADGGSEVARVVEEHHVGRVVNPGDAEQLRRVILEMYENRETLVDMGQRAREAALDKYSLTTAVLQYREELN
ncbi:MAG: glycosyltransferase family 4 protein [Pyrinomonadaceae bacterium]